jgi:hypothetical protein
MITTKDSWKDLTKTKHLFMVISLRNVSKHNKGHTQKGYCWLHTKCWKVESLSHKDQGQNKDAYSDNFYVTQ